MRELQPWIGELPLMEPPDLPGHRLDRVEKPNLTKLSLLGVPMLIVWLFAFPVVLNAVAGYGEISITIDSVPDFLRLFVQFLIAITVTFVVHEGIHGLAVILQGAKPSFGVGPGFLYTTVKESLSRNGYFAVAVSPALGINVGCFVLALQWPGGMGWWLAISTINMSGLGGDFWMALKLMKTPRSARIVDMADGFAVYSPGDPANDFSS